MNKQIKLIFFSMVLLFASNVFALAPKGEFSFHGTYELTIAKKFELVRNLSQEGKERVATLKQLGWTCLPKPENFTKCEISSKAQAIPEDIAAAVQAKYLNFKISFADEASESIENDSEYLKEYSVQQAVQFADQKIGAYPLQVLKGGMVKIQIPARPSTLYFIVPNRKQIQIQEVVQVTHGYLSETYVIQVYFSSI